MNGAAARLGVVGDKIIIMAFAFIHEKVVKDFKPDVVIVDDNNKPKKV